MMRVNRQSRESLGAPASRRRVDDSNSGTRRRDAGAPRVNLLLAIGIWTLAATSHGAGISKAAPQQPIGELHVYKTLGQRHLKLYVVKPDGWKTSDRRSGMVLFHGGGWVGGTPALL